MRQTRRAFYTQRALTACLKYQEHSLGTWPGERGTECGQTCSHAGATGRMETRAVPHNAGRAHRWPPCAAPSVPALACPRRRHAVVFASPVSALLDLSVTSVCCTSLACRRTEMSCLSIRAFASLFCDNGNTRWSPSRNHASRRDALPRDAAAFSDA